MHELLQKGFDILFPPSPDALLVRGTSPQEAVDCLSVWHIDGIIVLTRFERELIRALIHEAKFHYNRKALTLLGEVLQRYFTLHPASPDAMLIPIPLSKHRLRERGYNQVTEILKQAGYQVNEKMLVRTINTRPQTELKKEEREKNVANAFSVRKPDLITGKRILLIDDVFTTGATMRAAKAALLPHKPASVTCIAIAH